MFFRCGEKNSFKGDSIEFLPNLPNSNNLGIAELNGELYYFSYFESTTQISSSAYSTSYYLGDIYKLVDDTWTQVFKTREKLYYIDSINKPLSIVVSCNGAFYGAFGSYKFDGETFTKTKYNSYYKYFGRAFAYNNKIYKISGSPSVNVVVYDTETDTIEKELLVSSSTVTTGGYGNHFMILINNSIIACVLNTNTTTVDLYKLNSDDTWSKVGNLQANGNTSVVQYKNEVHLIGKGSNYTYLNQSTRSCDIYHKKYASTGYTDLDSIFSKLLPCSNMMGCEYNGKLVLCGFSIRGNTSLTNDNTTCIAIDLKGE